jgi:two-component system sensor histidine kinase/response regulator
MQTGQLSLVDFYLCEYDQRIYLAITIPIVSEPDKRKIGVLAFCIDPEKGLYPSISTWPTPSRTAEVLIVRREGNDVLFLNDLKFKRNAALRLRFSLDSNQELPAVKAALGQEGIVEGVDYRGVPVIAAVRAVANSPWFLIAGVDKSEVYAPVRDRMWMVFGFVGLLLPGAGAVVGLAGRQRRMAYYRERCTADEALRDSETKYRTLFEGSVDGITIANIETKALKHANTALCRMFGYSEQEMRTIGVTDIHPKESLPIVMAEFEAQARGEKILAMNIPCLRKDGTIFYAEISTFRVTLDGRACAVGFFRDITERKQAEEAVRDAELKYRTIADNTCDWEFWLAPSGRLLYVPPSCKRITGHDSTEFMNDANFMRRIIVPDDLAAWDEHLHEMQVGRMTSTLRFRIVHADSSERWIEHVCQPVYDNRGEFIGIRGSNRDITETKRLQALESRAAARYGRSSRRSSGP